MIDDKKLLVVDDEDVICQACRRILSPQGFQVETSNDAREGLRLATEKDYAAILLDIKMPLMDGIQFLQELRKTKRGVPVIIITGYPSKSSVTSSKRLGVADYITKPFTPEAITQAVQKALQPREIRVREEPRAAPPGISTWTPAVQEFCYWGESWLQLVKGGAVRVGAMLPRAQGGTVEAIWLPRVDWLVHQGLPLAGVTFTDGRHITVPSPISGVVIASNPLLLERPSVLWDDPCGDGWIACISPTRFEEDAMDCKPRRVVLANSDKASAREQSAQLTSLGCQVRVVEGLGDVGPALQQDPHCNVLVIYEASFGERGPELVRRINTAAPSVKIVVLASARCKWESAYREHTIFYYAVEPFADNEIVDIVDAVFRPPAPLAPQVEHREASSEAVSSIHIENRDGKKVGLLAEEGVLRRDDGLGWRIAQKLADRDYAVETTLGSIHAISTAIRQAASTCDHLLILLARDIGRLPGSLMREEFVLVSGEKVGKVTTLLVEPASSGGNPLEFGARTTAAMAEHIAREMTLSE